VKLPESVQMYVSSQQLQLAYSLPDMCLLTVGALASNSKLFLVFDLVSECHISISPRIRAGRALNQEMKCPECRVKENNYKERICNVSSLY